MYINVSSHHFTSLHTTIIYVLRRHVWEREGLRPVPAMVDPARPRERDPQGGYACATVHGVVQSAVRDDREDGRLRVELPRPGGGLSLGTSRWGAMNRARPG